MINHEKIPKKAKNHENHENHEVWEACVALFDILYCVYVSRRYL